MTLPIQPDPQQAVPPQPPPMPWTPFAPMPTDDEPLIAAMRRRKLEKLIDGAKFEGMDPTWQQVAFTEYQRMRQVESAAAMAVAQPQPKPQAPQPGGPST